MADALNPQAAQMAHESMVRNLRAQAEAIWSQETHLFTRYRIEGAARILDAGCGTGEIASRLAELFPAAEVLGVDVLDQHLELARARYAGLGSRLRFENRSVYDLRIPDATFDLTVCRHVIHAIPDADRVVAELVRVTRPGGRLHLVAEDYGMIHIPARRFDASEFWSTGPRRFGDATGTDLFVGRRAFRILRRLALTGITVDYVIVDTLRTPRATFAAIWEAWRDGYAEAIAEVTNTTREDVIARFDDQIATILDPECYAVWLVPVVSGVVPIR
jgi:SAM-dependent methyltransferase